MLQKLIEIAEKKAIRNLLLFVSFVGLIVCPVLIIPQLQNFFISIAETKILHKKIPDIGRYMDLFFYTGITYPVFVIAMLYFYIRKKLIASLCFLTTSFVLYFSLFLLIKYYGGYFNIVYFPLLILLSIIFVHIYMNRNYFSLKGRMDRIQYGLSSIKFLNSAYFVFFCGNVFGILFFINIFGTAILNFTYTDWLMDRGDLSQHYLGWKLFRNSEWYFPIGLMDNIVYPFKISIIYTDSIPLFAVIFKLLSPVIPNEFQYFGLFGIICYALQGGIGALIIRKISKNTIISIIGSLFFIFSTVMMRRIFSHTALSAHFILLLCILLSLHKFTSIKKDICLWGGLIALSVLIHMYFSPMVMVFLFFNQLDNYFKTKNIKNPLIVFSSILIIMIGTMYFMGAFHFTQNSFARDFTFYSANLNSFINPLATSFFIKEMPLATKGQGEGFAYLGLGMIIFIMIIIITKLFCKQNKPELKGNTLKNIFPLLPGVLITFLLFSFSSVITFNQHTVFTYLFLTFLINPIEKIFSAVGRFSWSVIYIAIFACISWAVSKLSVKKTVLLLSILLLIQWTDLSSWFARKGSAYKSEVSWNSKLSSPVWYNLVNDYKHILFLDNPLIIGGQRVLDYSYSFLDMAGNYKMTVNDAYLARTNEKMINDNKKKAMSHLLKGESMSDTLYVFMNDNERILLLINAGLNIYLVDNIIVVLNTHKSYLDEYIFQNEYKSQHIYAD